MPDLAKLLGGETPVVYLSGPMTGIPDFNFPAFEAATARLRELGIVVLSPHEHDLDGGFDPASDGTDFDLRAALEWDINAVLRSDAVIVLPGWQSSPGCTVEVAVAASMEIPVVEIDKVLGTSTAA